MIPISLTLKGLYSYQAAQTIDFRPLAASGLFGIFGPVGCGKSTILEAITFAIYGKTDRLNLSGDNRNYNMMNLRSDELSIVFEFEAGAQNNRYMSVVKGRRNSRNFEEVKKLDRNVYRHNGTDWEPVPEDEPEKAIGLSYDNFKRTVIIPQGQFQEFLQLGNKERTQMMQELFGLEKYELSAKTGSLENKTRAAKERLEGQLQQLSDVTPEMEIRLQEDQLLLRTALEKSKTDLAQLRDANSAMEQLQQLAAREALLQKRMEELKSREADIREKEQTIGRFEDALLRFSPMLNAIDSCNKRAASHRSERDSVTREMEETRVQQAEALEAFNRLKPQYETRQTLLARAAELADAVELKKQFADKAFQEERLVKGAAALQQVVEQLAETEKRIDLLEKALHNEKTALPDRMLLYTVKEWYTKERHLSDQLSEASLAAAQCQLEEAALCESLQREMASLPPEWGLPATLPSGPNPLSARIELIAWQLTPLVEAETGLRHKLLAERAKVQVQEHLEAFAETLKEGEPCPLCGALHHPERLTSQGVSEAGERLSIELLAVESTIEQLRTLSAHLAERGREAERLSERKQQLLEKEEERKSILKAYQATFAWEAWRNETLLQEAIETADALQQSIVAKEDLLRSERDALKERLLQRERYQQGIADIQKTVTICQTRIESISNRFALLKPADYEERDAEALSGESEGLKETCSRLEVHFEVLRTELTEHESRLVRLLGKQEVLRASSQKEEQELAALQNRLAATLHDSAFLSVEEVQAILSRPLDLAAEKETVLQFNRLLGEAEAQWAQLQTQRNGEVYDRATHEIIGSQLREKEELLNRMNREMGEISHRLTILVEGLKRRKVLQTELEEVIVRVKNLQVLRELFRGSKFVNYVSSVYLQNLCHSANERFFRLTRQRLRLEMASDNSFQVRDYLNGGKIRSVKTLSGGQIFQASLSLALALADNLRALSATSRNFFFLDEGFGSLDKESLAQVFDTLKSLRHENRIIGLISHVEEMQQEIDLYLRIENDEERGSLIRQPW